MKPSTDVGEASTSGHQGSSEAHGSNPQQQEIMMEIFLNGIGAGLREAQSSFPSLDIDTTMVAALNKGNRVRLSLPESELETKIYMEGIFNGLLEAKLRFPTLDEWAILATVLRKEGVEAMFQALDWTKVTAPSSDKSKLFCKALVNDKDEATSTNFDHKDGMKPSVDVGEASTSGHQGSSEAQGSDPQKEEIMMEIFLNGMGAGLREAQSSFPSLDIDTTMVAALNKGNWVRLSLPESELEMKMYMEGIINGLLEAKLSFPTLNEGAILATVLRKQGHKVMGTTLLDWTKMTDPSSGNPLLELFMMMKQESWESEANKSKLFCKLMEEHKALRKKFEEFENETSALDKDSCCLLPSSKNEYNELIEKLKTQFAELISKKGHSIDGTDDDAQAKESTLSDSKSALSSTNMHTDIGIEGCKRVAKYDKLGDVLKGRAEELRRLYDAGMEGFQSSREFQELMMAVYLNGLRDGLLEAQAILLALYMDRNTALVFEGENEEHVTHEVAKDEHVTAEAAKDDVDEAADNENPDETIGIADFPNATSGPEVDKPEDTSYPFCSQFLEAFAHFFKRDF